MIEDTNALNKPVTDYKQPIKVARGYGDRDSAPNYKKLSQTPARSATEKISGQVQYGQPAFDSKKTPKGKVPEKVSNRPTLKASTAIAQPKAETPKPLQTSTKKKSRIAKESKTIGKTPTKKFRNLFDNPLSQREIEQLKLAHLQGKDHKQTQELLNRLLVQSQQLAQALQPKLASPPPPRRPETAAERIQRELTDAQSDLQFLEQEYDKLDSEAQKVQIKRFRHKYYASRKGNILHIQKLVRDKITTLNEELQEVE